MHRTPTPRRFKPPHRLACLLLACLPLAGLSGCGPSDQEKAAARQSAAVDSEWAWIQAAKRELDQKRTLPAAADGPLRQEVQRQAAELNRRLVELINANPPVDGEPLSDLQKAALRLKSDEDIVLAQDFIARGGDYQRAIEIYEAALLIDPDHPRLKPELEKAKASRYMTRELFAQVKEGMRQEEVRGLLGQPNLHNVREYPDRNVVAWFYAKDPTGAAAGVWFEKKGGAYTVYELDFDAVTPRPVPRPEARPEPRPERRPERPAAAPST